ncbi:MAG TPA: TRAP transporter small permease [Rhizobiaceae bacterium]|nr:TRAP transporter small permease [Rhizobiaceae bacterium]
MHDDTGELAPPAAPARASAFDRLLDFISWLCMLVAGLSLVVIIVAFGWLVYGRYILNDTPTWVEQMSLLLVSYITFLGAAVGVRRNTHLSIDFVRESLPFLPRQIMRYLSDLFILVFGACMAWQGYLLFLDNTDRLIPMIDVAECWRVLPLGICGALMVLFAGSNIARRIAHGGQERE